MQNLKQSSEKKEIVESTSLPRSTGPQVNLVPLENRKRPGDEVGPQVPQGGGGEYSTKFFRGPTTYFITYHFWQIKVLLSFTFRWQFYSFHIPSLEFFPFNCYKCTVGVIHKTTNV